MRVAIFVRGTVQGVGFRPFVYREAMARGLAGWVKNVGDGVRIEAEGESAELDTFVRVLPAAPLPARVDEVRVAPLPDARAGAGFAILESDVHGVAPVLPPDLAACPECIAEVREPRSRRYRYPFTSCARCGPRYSIVRRLPYDRERTSMHGFRLCDACRDEYEDPRDRRFHAVPIACPRCGPELVLTGRAGEALARGEAALEVVCERLREGAIVAVLGVGGFQLLVDARRAGSVAELRARKRREARPFAVLFASLESLSREAEVDEEAAALLSSPEAPIVLLPRRRESTLANEVAPANPLVGALLPPTPLHTLLVEGAGGALVCTSGNPSGEPLCTDPGEALARLAGIADVFLTHERRVERPLDDSVVRPGVGILRRARGHAPRAVFRLDSGRTVLGVGAHTKSTIALLAQGEVVVSQHVGDLESPVARELLSRTTREFLAFFAARPDTVACDLHPDYASTRFAEGFSAELGVELVRVQHHRAHALACAAEHGVRPPFLALAWDGTGYGDDGTIWGGEAFVAEAAGGPCALRRFAHLRPFRLPGGERAAREPYRAAAGLVAEALPERLSPTLRRFVPEREADVLRQALERFVNAPLCSSVGRLLEGIAALCGLHARASFEGQAAMALEFAALGGENAVPYPLPLEAGHAWVADTRPLVRAVLLDLESGREVPRIAASVHEGLVELGVEIARRAGCRDVLLSGGCFQNALLSGGLRARLESEGYRVYCPRMLPPNDGAISAGQVVAAVSG